MDVQVRVPQSDQQEGVMVTVAKWFKRPGDHVKQFEPLVEISTNAVDLEMPSPATGILRLVYVKEGETASPGAVLGIIEQVAALTSESKRGITLARLGPFFLRLFLISGALAGAGTLLFGLFPSVGRVALQLGPLGRILGYVLSTVFGFWIGRTVASMKEPRIDKPAKVVLGVALFFAVVSWANYGTECVDYDDDPIRGGCVERVELFRPTAFEEVIHGLSVFLRLAVPALLVVWWIRREVRGSAAWAGVLLASLGLIYGAAGIRYEYLSSTRRLDRWTGQTELLTCEYVGKTHPVESFDVELCDEGSYSWQSRKQ